MQATTRVPAALPDIIVVGPGAGGGPHVKIFESDGKVRHSFFAYDSKLRGGVRVAAGDINGDGKAEVLVGSGGRAGRSAPAGSAVANQWRRARLFRGIDAGMLHDWLAFAPPNSGGVRVAMVANPDGQVDLVTAAGPGSIPAIRRYNGRTYVQQSEFLAYFSDFHGGVFVG